MRSYIKALSRDYDSVIAAVAGFIIIQVLCSHSGIGISPDSVIYISTAANILNKHMIYDFSGWPMMDFPAGFPFFLAGVQWLTRVSIQTAGPILDGLMFAGVIFTVGWLTERFENSSRWYKWAMLTIVVLSPCLLEVYSMIWSETLFILLLLLFIPALRRYLVDPTIAKLILPALIVAFICVIRYAGLSLIMLGGGFILCIRQLSWGKRLLHGIIFGIIASTLFGLNLYRNHTVTGTLTGYREKAVTSFSNNLHHYGSVLCDWLPFFNEDDRFASLVGVVFLTFATLLFIRRWFSRPHAFTYENIGTAWFILYSAFILVIASISRFQQLDSRLLSPLCISWIWASTSDIPAAVRRISQKGRPFRRVAIAVALLLFGCFQWGQYQTYQENWEGIKYAGIPGYTEDQWVNSKTMAFVRKTSEMHRPGAPVYSNAYEGIWFLTGVRSDLLPHKEFLQDIKEMMHEDHFWVIWFDDSINDDLISIDYILQYKKLSQEYSFDDGKVYFFTKK